MFHINLFGVIQLRFSQRMGITSIRNIIQVDSMDDALRNGLWNCVMIHYVNPIFTRIANTSGHKFFINLWCEYFKSTLDSIPYLIEDAYRQFRDYFFSTDWHEVYDLIEFLANETGYEVNNAFINSCNKILEKEMSGFRFVNNYLAPITSEEEIAAIEEATSVSITPVREHLNRSLELLADRQNPDYRNSIKESISAVESLCIMICNDHQATLGAALNVIEKTGIIKLHGALKRAFSSIYGWTSNAEGIRHGLQDEPDLSFEDAKYMLVVCSGFISYLLQKAEKAGLDLPSY